MLTKPEVFPAFREKTGSGFWTPVAKCLAVAVICVIGLLCSVPIHAAPFEVVLKASLEPDAPIPAPKEKVILSVFGAQAKPNAEDRVDFDRSTLEKIGTVTYTISTHWYDKPVKMEGVLLSKLLELVRVPKNAKVLRMQALNDYITEIPLGDAHKWPVMLALKMNGEYMSIRDKGPLWVVYPTHLEESLGNPDQQGKWIWQLRKIMIQ